MLNCSSGAPMSPSASWLVMRLASCVKKKKMFNANDAKGAKGAKKKRVTSLFL